jgi:diacylglycerol kinase family enzyme
VAVGKYTDVSYAVKRKHVRRFGVLAYVSALIPNVFRKYRLSPLVQINGQVYHFYMNSIYIFNAYRTASIDLKRLNNKKKGFVDDELEIVLFKRKGIFSHYKIGLFWLFKGKVNKRDIHLRSNQLEITFDKKQIWNVDGEGREFENVKIELVKDTFNIFCSATNKNYK